MRDAAPPRAVVRPAARAGLWLLFLLAGSAALAPLLAGDQPLLVVGVDLRAHERARRSLALAAEELDRALEQGRAHGAEERALRLRLDALGRGARAADAEPLRELERALAARLAGASREPLAPIARGAAERLVAAADGEPGIALRERARSPLLASLAPLDAGLAALWLALATAPAWWRRRRRAGLAACGAAAVLAAGAALALGGAPPDAGLKQELARGGVRASRVVFPPVAFGYAETHLEEALARPSWLAGGAPAADVRPGEPRAGSPWRHPLGTDALGRDVLARLLHGGRLSLAVGLLATALAVLLGATAGALAGVLGPRADALFLRTVEVVQSFPALLLVLAGVALVPRGALPPALTIALCIGLVRWTGVARLVRGELLSKRELGFALAARALGLGPARIAFRHLLPAALSPVLVAAAFAASDAVLVESSISFLGLGTGPPVPSWGGLIASERDTATWWLQLFPGLCVLLTVAACNLVGEGAREALDPRLGAGANEARERSP